MQLRSYFNDCTTFKRVNDNLVYDKENLMNLFIKYGKSCSNGQTFTTTKKGKINKISIIAGATSATANLTDPTNPSANDAVFNNSINPTFGLSLDYIISRSLDQWSFNNDILITFINTMATHENISSPTLYTITNFQIDYTYLKLLNSFQYRFSHTENGMYLNAGISIGIGSGSSLKNTEENFNTRNEMSTDPIFNISKGSELGFTTGIGYQLGDLSGEFRFEKSTGMSAGKSPDTQLTRFYFLISYLIKRNKK